MTVSRNNKGASGPAQERRSGKDRRSVEKGPPGRSDRRRGVEPRQPEVTEVPMSPSQWGRLNQPPELPTPDDES